MITIRGEISKDIPEIREINKQAFGQPQEANIVDKIRSNCTNILSLVAVDGDDIVGHIFFSPALIESEDGVIEGMGLAPMAVLPDCQNQGIGSELVRKGLEILREKSCTFVIVLGHPGYYPRFGFERASDYRLKSQWEGVPDEAFMIIFFDDSLKRNISGIAKYRGEFNEAMGN